MISSVLVVDDEPLICMLIGEYFRDVLGMRVDCAMTGEDGAISLAHQHFDLAIIDVGLEDEIAFELAANAANDDTAVLLISGRAETNFKLKQFQYPYLAKPFTLETLGIEGLKAMQERQTNIQRIMASAVRRQTSIKTTRAAFAQSDRILDMLRTMPARSLSQR